jgi:hypothetical protein
VLVILPQGTNTDKPSFTPATPEDRMLWAKNKWLLAHPDSAEAKAGAWIGLTGPNIDLERLSEAAGSGTNYTFAFNSAAALRRTGDEHHDKHSRV